MSAPMFSLLHASRGRPAKAVEAMQHALAVASNRAAIEYIVACNDDDQETIEAFDKTPAIVVFGPYRASVEAWDWAAKVSKGEIIIQVQDDLVLEDGWDTKLIRHLRELQPPWSERPAVIAVNDGFRRDRLLCTAIVNRARYVQQGEFLHCGYDSMYSDDEFSVRAYADADEGRCKLIDARDITFRHDNVYHLKGTPDATALRQNSPEAYRRGAQLFAERNGHLMKYRTWN